jgi:diguanylate cyclase (GGDEF)-like protein/PAS domain S-box-containing protein
MNIPLRVLVVEDSEADAVLLTRQLRQSGYEPRAVRVDTAEEMHRLLDQQSWDLVVADYSMPRFNAVAALMLLKEKGLDVPFIILSGTIGEETAVEAMKAGAHDYIMKGNAARLIPAIERELREAVERATRRKAERRVHENERRFRSLIERSSDITTVVDRTGRILYASPSVKRLLGRPPEDLVGSNIEEHVHPEDAARLHASIGGPFDQELTSVEFRFEVSGEFRVLEATVNNLLDNPDIGGVVLNCRDITARKQDAATIRHLAYFDALTSLPNRMLFNDRLTQALAHARRKGSPGLAVLFLDLDRFKAINETLGHGAGDEILRIVAQRLAGSVREEDTVARLGGDEFLFLLPGIDDVQDAARVAQKILGLFNAPFHLLGHELHVTTSIGISMFPLDGHDIETLIRNADTALYRAKEQGGNRYQLYAPAMNAVAFKRLVLENNLRRAIDRNELTLFYQPMVSLQSGEPVGVEALLRWQHPDLGLVSPGEFIPLAEETGLIVPLTRWVLRTACAQMKEWQRAGIRLQTVSTNVSAYQFNDSDLPLTIAEALRSADLEARHLCVELTESVMMENAEETIRTIQEIKKLGLKISMDDFGTGYSSLSYLRRLPIDTLKIDKSFVRQMPHDGQDAAIAMLIIGMARNLQLSVVAEGVETEEQMEFLRVRDCDMAQGYLISRPLPAADVPKFLLARQRA